MKKCIIYALSLFITLFPSSTVFALSDVEYTQMMNDSSFAEADKKLRDSWKQFLSIVNKKDKKSYIDDQKFWVQRGRDILVEHMQDERPSVALEASGEFSRVKAYTAVTNARTYLVAETIRQMTDANYLSSFTGKIITFHDAAGGGWDFIPEDSPVWQPIRISYYWDNVHPALEAFLTNIANTDTRVKIQAKLDHFTSFKHQAPDVFKIDEMK